MGETAAESPAGPSNRARQWLDWQQGSPGAGPSTQLPLQAAGAAAGTTAAPQPQAPAPSAPPPGFAVRLHQAVACFAAITQAVITSRSWSSTQTAGGKAQTLVILAASVAWAASSLLIPAFFWRHHLPLTSLSRIAIALFPFCRQTGVGAALMLERPPQPGWLGAAADLGRTVSGTRLLGFAVGGLAIPLPLGVTLVTQLSLFLLMSNSPVYCSTQLLAAQLTRSRAAAVAAVLERAALPVLALLAAAEPAGLPGQPAALQQQEPGMEVCRATLLMLQASLGVLSPTLLVAWRQPAWRAAREEGEEAAPCTAAGPAAGEHEAPCLALFGWARRSPRRALAAANRALAEGLRSANTGLSRAALAWFLGSLCWALCKRWAGLALLSPAA